MAMGEHDDPPHPEVVDQLFQDLGLSAPPVNSQIFLDNNFFNAAFRPPSSEVNTIQLTNHTPETVLLTELVSTVHPEVPKQELAEYIEPLGNDFQMWRGARQNEGKWPQAVAFLHKSLPNDAEISRIFTAAREFIDGKFGIIYDDLVDRTELMGIFLTAFYSEDDNDDGDHAIHNLFN